MNNESKIISIANARLASNANLQAKLLYMDAMNHVEWEAPWTDSNPKPGWWRDFPTSQPAVAIRAYTRMFSKVGPIPTLSPLQDDDIYKKRCNEIESALMWQYHLLNTRGANVTADVVQHAGLYGKVCLRVVYLPWQRKVENDLEIRPYNCQGDFAYILEHPANVHEFISPLYGLQNVLVVKEVTGDDLVEAWGKNAAEVKKIVDADPAFIPVFRLIDWTDERHRVVLAYQVNSNSAPQDVVTGTAAGSEHIVLCNEEHKLPFIDWSIEYCGCASEKRPEYRVSPLLDNLYQGKRWESENFWRSMMRSDTIATALAPKGTAYTMDGDAPAEDYSTPGGVRNMRVGEQFTPSPPLNIDPRMREFLEQDESEAGLATIPRIIADPGVQSGVSFASTNQMYSAAESTLDPFRTTAERAFNGAYKLMLLWKMHTKDPLNGMKISLSKKTEAPSFGGDSYSIPGAELPIDIPADQVVTGILSPSQIYMTTKLSASNPLDQVSEINVVNMKRQAGFPDAMIYEQAGYVNPNDIVDGRYKQQLKEAAIGIALKKLQAQGDAAAQKVLGMAQMEMQQMQARIAQQMQQGATPPPGSPAQGVEVPPNAMAAGGMPPNLSGTATEQGQITPEQQLQQTMARAGAGAQGPGMNLQDILASLGGSGFQPGQGGESPLAAAPGALTKEAVTKKARR